MDEKRKKHIDSLWSDTKFGKWVVAAAYDMEAEANAQAIETTNEFPFTLEGHEKIVANKIAAEMKHKGEFLEYLKVLDEEEPDLVEFMISQDIFGELY